MKLPFLEKKEKPTYFLALILRDDKAIAIVFQELAGVAKVVGKGEELLKDSIEHLTEEDLLNVCDKIISTAETSLPEGEETKKTIFSLKESWILENKIKKEYLDKLKKVSDELGLTPIGFILTSEAILNLLQKEEGAPVSAILVQADKREVTVSIVKAGKISEQKTADIHENIPFTADTLLKHFEISGILPTRLIIFAEEAKDLADEFVAHSWSKSLPFLHLPQIVPLRDDFDTEAVLSGAAKQLGLEIMPEFTKSDMDEPVEEEEKKDEDPEDEELPKETSEEEKEDNKEDEEKEEEPPIHSKEHGHVDHEMEKFGFIKGDIANVKEEHKVLEPENFTVTTTIESIEEKRIEENQKQLVSNFKTSAVTMLNKIKELPSSFTLKGGKKKLILPIALVVLIIGMYLFFTFIKSATIQLGFTPKGEQKTEQVTFSISGTSDPENRVIAAQFVETAQTGSVSTQATGKKETGDPAKGTITLYSRFTQDKTIPQGTTITGPNGIDLTTDKDVKLASASADASADPVKANVGVTAKKIGKEGNLPSGTKFGVGSFSSSDVIAKNDSAFSGGNKKDITVVSKDDQEKLSEDIVKNLQEKAKENLAQQAGGDTVLLPSFVETIVEDEEFSKKVGDEASTVTLKATVKYKGLTYNKKDLVSFVKTLIENQSAKFRIDESKLATEVSEVKKKNEKQINAKLKIDAKLFPEIKNDELLAKIKGKGVEEAREELERLNQISKVDISVFPNLPFIGASLPGTPDKINLKVASND